MFILAAQVIRLLLMLFAAPLIARAFTRLGQPHDDLTDSTSQINLVPCVATTCANAVVAASDANAVVAASDNGIQLGRTISLASSAPRAAYLARRCRCGPVTLRRRRCSAPIYELPFCASARESTVRVGADH
jgi:hypothetical protein